MTDVEKQKQMEQIKQSEDGMRQTVLLIKIGFSPLPVVPYFSSWCSGTRGLQIPGI